MMPMESAQAVGSVRKRKRQRVWVVAGAALLLTVAAGLFLVQNKAQTIPLSNGALELAKVSYGKTEHDFVCGSSWDRLVYDLTPASWMRGRRPSLLKAMVLRRAMASLDRVSTGTNHLAVWFAYASSNSATIRVQLRGSNGIYWSSPTAVSRVAMNRRGQPEQHLRFVAPSFPRREKYFLMDIYELVAREYKLAGSFRVANPAFRTYPNWHPPRWLDSVEVGNAQLVLQPIVNRGRIEDPFKAREATFNLENWQKGSTMNGWVIGPVVISDATGNNWRASAARLEHDTWVYTLDSKMPTNEVLKLQTKVWRDQRFESSQMWTISSVPLPKDGEFASVTNLCATRDGSTVEFLGLGGKNARVPGVLVSGGVQFAYFQVTPAPTSATNLWKLYIVDLQDEKGESLVYRRGALGGFVVSSDESGKIALPMEFRRDAEKGRLVLAWSKVETIELYTGAGNQE
jgi:hypothetical protein